MGYPFRMERLQAPELLRDIAGVGPALLQRIETAYGSLDAFLTACKNLDLDRLLEIEGLSERRALDLVAAVRNRSNPELAHAGRGQDVRRELEDLLAGFAQTEYGKRRVRMLPVLRDESQILKGLDRVAADRKRLEGLDRVAIARSLARVARPREPRPTSTGRILVVDGDDDEFMFRSAGYDRWLRIVQANNMRTVQVADVVLDCTSEGWEGENAVRLGPRTSLAKAVPESELGFVETNRATLQAISELSRLLGVPTVADQMLLAAPAKQDAPRVDIKKAAKDALVKAQSVFESQVANLSLNGAQILEFLSKGLTKGVDTARSAAVAEGREVFKGLTGIAADPFDAGLPLKIDDDEVERLTDEHESRIKTTAFEAMQKSAAVVQQLRSKFTDEVAHWLEFDVRFALASFSIEFDAHAAQTSNRLVFRRAVHVRLRGKAGIQPIDYELGGDAPIAVLTGANSGGKTSLLELTAQLVLLHHWGVPVPAAEAEIPIFQEVVFLGATRSADAGAFESFLRELFPPLTRPGRKLLLLDEVESVTELEAAGRILGVFIDEAARSQCLGVLVTHLPNEILGHARTRVRTDGIDAVGLDEKFNLIVDRQPKLNHRARSTPELILRRVHSKSQGAVKDLYAKVLGRWG